MGPAPSQSPCVSCKKAKTTKTNNNDSSTMDVEHDRPSNEQPKSAATEAQKQRHHELPTTPQTGTEHAIMTRVVSYLLLFAFVFLGAYVLISSYCVSNEWFLANCEAVGGRVKVKVAHGFFSTSTRLACELSDDARRKLTG